MVRDKAFREDLFYRLAMVEIELPPLANRREDLPLLERYFIQKFSAEYNKNIVGLLRRVQIRLATYAWPGNIRELENVIGNACMMAEGTLIDIDDLPERLHGAFDESTFRDEAFLSLEEMQRRHALRVLQGVGGNKTRAAEVLKVSRAWLYEVLDKSRLKEKSKLEEKEEKTHRADAS
jgi:transcriptional regulator with PAS, ATPase and Fis domain